jgi:hypothetical protein
MSYITVTNSFANNTAADATQVNTNFNDVVNGLSLGTKDINVTSVTIGSSSIQTGSYLVGTGTGVVDFFGARISRGAGSGTISGNLVIRSDSNNIELKPGGTLAPGIVYVSSGCNMQVGLGSFFCNGDIYVTGSATVSGSMMLYGNTYFAGPSCRLYLNSAASGEFIQSDSSGITRVNADQTLILSTAGSATVTITSLGVQVLGGIQCTSFNLGKTAITGTFTATKYVTMTIGTSDYKVALG